MRWKRGRGGQWIDDRRGRGGGGMFGGGGGGRMPLPIPMGRGGCGGGGLVSILLVLAVLYFSGGLGGGGGGLPIDPGVAPFPQADAAPADENLPDEDLDEFVGYVVEDVQDAWARLFTEAGQRYQPTKTVLYTGATQTGCGTGSAQAGPFYCPVDRQIYLDLSFFRELRSRFRAPGDFAIAYVIAHEYGHHVQNLLGIMDDVRRGEQEHPDERNELSVRLELQADCFAGVWGHTAIDDLEEEDLQEGIDAAAAVGDDRLQEEATGRIDRESWTHGSAEQRKRWFRKGFDTGDANACNTFQGEI